MNCVHVSKVLKFLAESPSVTTHAIQSANPFYSAHLLIIQLQLSGLVSCFYVHYLSVEDIPKICLTF